MTWLVFSVVLYSWNPVFVILVNFENLFFAVCNFFIRMSDSIDPAHAQVLMEPTVCEHCHTHYENSPMQYTEIFVRLLKLKFHEKNFDDFNSFVQNFDCGYYTGQLHRGGSDKYPQSMFWIKTKKNDVSLNIPVLLCKSGV